MSLPSDFWTVPDAYGVAGMFVGLAIGMPLLCSSGSFTTQGFALGYRHALSDPCATAGMLVGELVRAVWLGYLW